jgi:rRNA-processing protein FCF1
MLAIFMKLLLDTNFILECMKNKIDLSDLETYGDIILPIQVYAELSEIMNDKRQKEKNKSLADLALQILNRKKFKKINLNSNKADEGIEIYTEENKDVIVATMDRELKKKIKRKSRILTIRNKKKIVLL